MHVNLEGEVALVTGAGSGIGRAIAHKLASNGAAVAVNDLDAARAQAVVAEIGAQGGRARPAVADITDYEQVQAAVEDVLAAWGRIDILVNNAGWDTLKPFLKKRREEIDRILEVNLRGPIYVTHLVAAHMCARKAGNIVNIASDAGRVGSLGEAVYSGCKGGIIAISKTWAREFARDGVRVNVVSPGLTDTPLLAALQESEFGRKVIQAIVRQIPLGLGKPEQIAEAVLFFASDASAYVTGQVLSVSGGLTFHD